MIFGHVVLQLQQEEEQHILIGFGDYFVSCLHLVNGDADKDDQDDGYCGGQHADGF